MEVCCETCGRIFNRRPSSIRDNIFCSRHCFNKKNKQKNIIHIINDCAEIILKSKKHGDKNVLIDIEDIDKVSKYNWYFHKKGYVMADNRDYKKRAKILIHRYITNCPENLVIDHVNHNKLDNRKQNLKICTQFENMQNLNVYLTNKSGHKNISFQKKCQKWIVTIRENNKNKTVGRYDNLENAINARDKYKETIKNAKTA